MNTSPLSPRPSAAGQRRSVEVIDACSTLTVRGRGGKRPSGGTPNLRLDDALVSDGRGAQLTVSFTHETSSWGSNGVVDSFHLIRLRDGGSRGSWFVSAADVVQEYVKPRRAMMIGLHQDVEVSVAIEISQFPLVNSLTG